MSVRQYYYTSYVHRPTGSAGFHVKAMSPDLSPELQETIARLIAYRIPPSLDVQMPDTHPVALRYAYKGPDECILLCSQSCGHDEFGRPGNFFAHAVVVEQDLFTSIPPVFFWKSAFWCKHDSVERVQIASLPVLPTFDEEPSLDLEEIWAFVAEGRRRDLLYNLLCGVVQSHRKQWRIVIFDSDEHVALWVAAVSCLLPPAYRPLLTFATYHHDPRRAPFLIIGADAASRPTLEDDASFFLLDATRGKTSPVEPSPYAALAVSSTHPELYETVLLSIFTDLDGDQDSDTDSDTDSGFTAYTNNANPAPLYIDEQLDQLALHARSVLGDDVPWLHRYFKE